MLPNRKMMCYFQASFDKYHKYGSVPNAIDVAKFVAIITMVIDHLGCYFFQDELWFRVIGRMSFPIWGFLSGYSRPSKFNYDIYVLCVLLIVVKAVAFISSNPLNGVFVSVFPINILATIIICRFYADFLRKNNKYEKWTLLNLIFIFITLIIWLPITNYMFEYGTVAFMFAICGVLQREQPGHLHSTIAFAFSTIAFVLIEYLYLNFSVPQFIVVACGTLTIAHFLSGFKMKQFPYLEKFGIVTKTGMFFARNSLYFYFLHVVLFAIVSRMILV